MMNFTRKNSRPGMGTRNNSGSSSSSRNSVLRLGRTSNSGEALAGAEYLVHGIMGKQAEVNADTCKQALEKYYVLEAQTKRLSADLQKSQRNRMSSAQLARLRSEANQTQWNLTHLENVVQQRDETIEELEDRIRVLEGELADYSLSQSLAAIEEENAEVRCQLQDETSSADSSLSSSSQAAVEDVIELESQNARLESQVQALQSEKTTANILIEELKGKVEQLQDDQRVNAKLNAELESQIQVLQDEVSQQKLLEEQASRVLELERRNLELESTVERLYKEVGSATETNDDLRRQVGQQRNNDNDQEHSQGGSSIVEMELLNWELENQQDDDSSALDSKDDQVAYEGIIADLRRQTTELQNKIRELEEDKSVTAQTTKRLRAEDAEIISEHQSQISVLENQLDVFRVKQSDNDLLNELMKDEAEERRKQIADLEGQVQLLQEHKRATLEQIESMKDEVIVRFELERKSADLERQVNLLEEERKATLVQLESLREEKSATVYELEEQIADLRCQIDMAQFAKISEGPSTACSLPRTPGETKHCANSKTSDLDKQSVKNAYSVEARLSESEKRNEDLSAKLEEANKKIAVVKAAIIPRLEKLVDDLTGTLQDCQKDISISQKKMEGLSSQLEKHRRVATSVPSFQDELKEVKEENDCLSAELQICQAQLLDKDSELEALSAMLTWARGTTEQVSELEKTIKNTVQENQRLRNDLENCNAELQSAKAQVGTLSESLDEEKEALIRLEHLAGDKTCTIKELEILLSAAKSEIVNRSAYESQVKSLSSQLDESQKIANQVQELEKLFEQKQTLEGDKKALLISLEEVGAIAARVPGLESAIQATTQDRSRLEKDLFEYKEKLSAAESEVNVLSVKLKESQDLSDQLDKSLNEKSRTNQSLAGRLAVANEEIRSLSSNLEEANATAVQVPGLEALIKERDDKLQNLEGEIRSNHSQLTSATSEIEALALALKETSKVAERIPDLEKSLESMSAANLDTIALRSELEEAKKCASQVSELKRVVAEANADKRQLDCELQVCRVELSSAKSEVKRLSAVVAESRNQAKRIAELEHSLTEKGNENTELGNRLTAAETVIMSLSTRLEKTRDDVESATEFEHIAREKETELKETSRLLETCQTDLSKAENDIQRLSTKLKEVREKAERVDEAESLLQREKEEKQELIARLTLSQNEIQGLLDQSETAKQLRRSKAEGLQSKIDELQSIVSTKEDENLALQADLKECQDKLSSIQTELEVTTESLEAFRHTSNEIEALQAQNEEQRSDIERVSSQLEECRADLSDAWDENSKVKTENELLKNKLAQCRAQLTTAKSQCESLSVGLGECRADLSNAWDENSKAKKENDLLRKELTQCRTQLTSAKSESESLSAILVDTRVNLAEAQARVNILKARENSEKITAREVSLQTQLSEAKFVSANEIRSMQDRLDDLEDQLTFTDEKNQALRRELTETQQKLLNVQAKNRILGNKNVVFDKPSEASNLVSELSEAKAVAKRNFDEVIEMRRLIKMKNKKIAVLVKRLEDERRVSENLRSEISDFGNQLFDAEDKVSSLEDTLASIQKILEVTERKKLRLETETARLKEVEKQFVEASETLEQLRSEVTDRKEDPGLSEEAAEGILKMQEQIDGLEREKIELSAEIEKLRQVEEKSKQNSKTIDSLRQELRGYRVKEEQKHSEVQRVQRSQEQVELLRQENEKLRADVARLEESEKRFAQYNATVDSLRRDVMETNATRVRELQEKRESLERDNKECHAFIDDLKNRLADERTNNTKLMDEIALLEKSLAETSREAAYRMNSSVAKKQDLEGKYRRLSLQHNELLQQYDDLQNQLSAEFQENSKQADNIMHLKASLEAMEKANASLQSQVDLLKEAEQLAAQDCANVSSLEKKLAVAKARVEEAEQVIDEFAELEEQLHQATLDNERMHEILDQFRAKLAASEGTNAAMAKRLSEYEGKGASDFNLDQEAAITSLREELEVARKEAEKKGALVEKLQQELEDTKEAQQENQLETEELISALRKKLEEAEARVEQAEQGEDENDLLSMLREDLEVAKVDADKVAFENEKLVTSLRCELDQATEAQLESDELIFSLRCELDDMRAKAQNAEHQTALTAYNTLEERSDAQKELEQKELELNRLRGEIQELQNNLTASRSTTEELEQELKYSRAKLSELSDILEERGDSDTDDVLQQKCIELAEAVADRDLLRQKLKATEAKAQGLEQECEKKKHLVQELSQSWDTASSSENNIARLQEEYDLSLKRATDLSVQLAESRMKIDELTEEVKKARQREENEHQNEHMSYWQNGFSKNIAKAFAQSRFEEIGHAWLQNSSEHGPKMQNVETKRRYSASGTITTADDHADSAEDSSTTIRKLLQQIETLKGERNAFEASLSAYKSQLEYE